MFKNIMAVDIGSNNTKIIVGNSRKVKLAGMFKTPDGSIEDGNIIMPDDYAKAFQKFVDENSIKEKSVSIALSSSDTLIRHLEVPIMDTGSIRKSVEWEINQYLPNNGKDHYMDFEIIDKINTHDKKVYKILVAAAPKNKIDSYMKLFESIGLEVDSIDIAANCIARVFKGSYSRQNGESSIGIVDIGFKTSNIVVLDNGKLFMEKQVNIGIDDMVMNISQSLDCAYDMAYKKLFENYDDIKNIIAPQFEMIYDEFEKLIQFYTTGKSKKNLDNIYLIGGGEGIKGIDKITSDYFSSPVMAIDSPLKLPIKVKISGNFDVRMYINNIGLFAQKGVAMQELNLIPDKYKRQKYNLLRTKDIAAIAVIAISVIFAALYIPYESLKNIKNKQIQLKKKCMVYENVKNENTKYKNQIKTLQKYISAYESISKSKVMVSTAISGIQNYTPSDITFDKLTYDNKLITVNAHTSNYSSIYIFAANLEQSKEYNGMRVGTVKFDNDKKWYDFTITMSS